MNLKTSVLVLSIVFITTSALGGEPKFPTSLRGGIKVDQRTIDIALEMQKQGWVYVMPRPKSKQAGWGKTNGRTTWWVGYWLNEKTKQHSSTIPMLKDGAYVGDGKSGPGWRRGGSPRRPTKLEWLLSKSGGISPKD